MNRPELKYQPQVFENGWYCACGAFHPGRRRIPLVLLGCGCDRILLQNALNSLLGSRNSLPRLAIKPCSSFCWWSCCWGLPCVHGAWAQPDRL